ncbi:MAG: hypothetical protein AB1489_14225 [Acidobacteriota bacterium]
MKRLFSTSIGMSLSIVLTSFLFAVIGCAQVKSSSAPESSSLRFNTPTGWQRIDRPEGTLLRPADTSQGVIITVLPGEALKGKSFRTVFEQALVDAHKGLKVTTFLATESGRNSDGYDTLASGVITDDGKGQQLFRYYLGLSDGSSIHMIVYVANNKDAFVKYQPVVKEFINGTTLNVAKKSLPSSIDRSSGSGNGISGLFTRTETRQQLNIRTNLFETRVVQTYYLFFPDGRLYNGLPKGGSIDNFDFDAATKTSPNICGYYRIEGNKIAINWLGERAAQSLDFQRIKDAITINKIRYDEVKRYNGLIAGTYSISNYFNLSGGVATGSASSTIFITFGSDGRFTEQGFANSGVATSNSRTSTNINSRGSGTYRINNYTLQLNYDDGRKESCTFFVYPGNENGTSPKAVIINGGSWLLNSSR